MQDGGLFVKYRPLYRELQGAGKLGLLFGTGASFPLTNYAVVDAGALGQKAVTVPLRGIVQWETPFAVFFNLTGGHTWRLDRLRAADIAAVQQERPDYVPVQPVGFSTLLFKIGLPTKHFYGDAWLEWQHSRGGADFVPDVPDLPQAYGVSYTQVGGTAYYSDSGKTGVYLSGGYILGGRNVSRIRRVTVGLVVKIMK